MGKYFLPIERRVPWLLRLLERYDVFVPIESEGQVHWRRLNAAEVEKSADPTTAALRRIRASEPVKSFMFHPRTQVGSFPGGTKPVESKPRVLFGIKACDLAALKVHDHILGEGSFRDPFYVRQRQTTMLVAADCPVPEETCFCNLLGLSPFVTQGADAAVSVAAGAWLFEPGEKGQELVDLAADLFQQVAESDERFVRRDEERRTAAATLGRTNPKPLPADLPSAVAKRRGDESFWRRHSERCVECFGCIMGCPTCYCFLLYDQAKGAGFDRTRVWDACYLAAYARVGGGANPRAEFLTRFANRFVCKFSDFKTDHGMYSCTGCGRCYKACMGKIDIRKVLGEL